MKKNLVLVLNAGSSSLKYALFEGPAKGNPPRQIHAGQVENIGQKKSGTKAKSHETALGFILDELAEKGYPVSDLSGAGHRVVHGGERFSFPVLVNDKVLEELGSLEPLAPHHMPHNIGAIKILKDKAPELPQVACFDTAFHATIPEVENRLPLPALYVRKGIRHYGFHGLNYQHVTDALPKLTGQELPARVLIAHLGNGASMCAVKNGSSVSTTMGFSTLDGLIMGTRSGNIDPGVLIHLMRSEGLDMESLEDLLYNKSGLLGLSGTSGNMRDLVESRTRKANFAINKYCHAAAGHAATLINNMQGLDAIVFTGGIGENAPKIRGKILDHLSWLGVRYNKKANRANQAKLATKTSTSQIWIAPANEEANIAGQVFALLG